MWACIDLRPLKWSCYGNLYCCCHWWSVWQVSLQNIIFMLVAQGLWILIYRFFFFLWWRLGIQNRWQPKRFYGKECPKLSTNFTNGMKSSPCCLFISSSRQQNNIPSVSSYLFFFQAGIESWWKRISQVSISERHSLSSSWMCSHSF